MNMEAIFILTYAGVILGTTALVCLGYWISERVKGLGSWKQVKRWLSMAVNTALQVAILWFCSMGITFCLVMLYWIFARPAELTVLVDVIAYAIGVAVTVGMWTAIWLLAKKD